MSCVRGRLDTAARAQYPLLWGMPRYSGRVPRKLDTHARPVVGTRKRHRKEANDLLVCARYKRVCGDQSAPYGVAEIVRHCGGTFRNYFGGNPPLCESAPSLTNWVVE